TSQQCAGEGQQINKEKKSDQQRDRTSAVLPDMRVKSVCRHGSSAVASGGPPTVSEFDLRGLFDLRTGLAKVEEFPAGKSERSSKQCRRKLLDCRVAFLDGIIEEAAGCCDL